MATRPRKTPSTPRSGPRSAIPDPDLTHDEPEGDEDDLWFLPGPDEEEDLPPGAAPREGPTATLFDPAPWREAEGAHARELAEVAALFGALDQRQRMGPPGWRQRLALREVSDLGWWTGDRVDPDRLALWIALRVGSTRDNAPALARAGWAVRRLTQGFGPEQGLSGFLERRPRAPSGPEVAVEDSIADLAEVMVAGEALHPVTAAARLFQAWGALGPDGAAGIEAAVLAARHAAGMARRPGEGALFLPLAQTGAEALRGHGDAQARLSAWLRGAERATLAALLHLDRVAAWRERAAEAVADLSGRTPPALVSVLESWPQVSAPLAEAETGASRAAVQRNLRILEDRDLIREVTGQGRYRVWAATI